MEKRNRGSSVNVNGAMLDAIHKEMKEHPELWPSLAAWVHDAIKEKLVRDRKHQAP